MEEPSKDTSQVEKRRGPKLFGQEKRVRTTLTFDAEFLEAAKLYVEERETSVSLWLEQLGKKDMQKSAESKKGSKQSGGRATKT